MLDALELARPLDRGESQRLRRYLKQYSLPHGEVSYSGLKGLITAIGCAPFPIQPGEWVPVVFPHGLPNENAESGLSLLMRYYNQIVEEVNDCRIGLPANAGLREPLKANFTPDSVLSQWSRGFALGLELSLREWEALELPRNSDAWRTLSDMHDHLTFFADETRARKPKHPDGGTAPFGVIVSAVRESLPQLIKDYALLCLSVREAIHSDEVDYLDEFDDMDTQELLHRGWNSENPEEARYFMEQVLEREPDNSTALTLVAELNPDPVQRVAQLEKIVHDEEARLGKAFFRDNAGHFWGLVETRDFMRALASLAYACGQSQRWQEASAHLERLLHLNPNDNQGLRYTLINVYLRQTLLDKAQALIDEYDGDGSASWRYSRALLNWVREGDSATSRALRRDAIAHNKHVPKLLTGRNKLPDYLPPGYTLGSKEEAELYAADAQALWRQYEGAMGWLLKG